MEGIPYSNPVFQAFVAGLFTWLLTAFGASAVLLKRDISQRLMDGLLGMAAGIMLAASFFSLLLPAIEMVEGITPVILGFMAGGIFLRVLDTVIPHVHPVTGKEEGLSSAYRKITLFALAVTIHNIPEGMAVGVAFGTDFNSGLSLAFGIGLQNIPEGLAIAMPLISLGYTRFRSFMYSSLSAVVEPIFALAGAFAVVHFHAILPYALSFAAGAMIFVVVEDLIPEAESNGNEDIATMMALLGFAIMMGLDVAFG